MYPVKFKVSKQRAKEALSGFRMAVVFVVTLVFSSAVFGQPAFGGADEKVCGFFDNINGLLNMASIAVVTIAVIFAGYQISFAHKRIADVAPILVGGLLIGGATQISKMLIGDTKESCQAMIMSALSSFYA